MKSLVVLPFLISALISYSQTIPHHRASPNDLEKLREIDRARIYNSDDRDYGLFFTNITLIEDILNQKNYGAGGNGLGFRQLIEKLRYLSIKYKLLRKHKIDLNLDSYEKEFAFYQSIQIKNEDKNRPVIDNKIDPKVLKKADSISRVIKVQESQKRVKELERLDSIEAADKKMRLYNDSIEKRNEERRWQRQIEAEKIRQQKLAENREKEVKESAKKIEARRQELIAKYGITKASLIFNKKVEIGWSKEMCLESWGKPREINRTTTALVKHEQWVYSLKRYLYFDNEILSAIQD